MRHVCGFLILAAFSSLAFAGGRYHCHSNSNCHSDEHEIIQGLNAIANPGGLLAIECSDPNAPAWCKDLFKSACENKKSTDKLGQLKTVIDQRTYMKLPKSPMKSQINDAAEAAVKLADELVYKQGKVVRKDVVDTFLNTKTILFQTITSNNFLPAAKKAELYKKVEKTSLRTGFEYVEDLIKYGKQQDPSATAEDLRRTSLQMYMSACGANGLEVNAFNHEGNIVLCPGLVYSLDDYDTKGKTDILNALSFTIGHEIGHSIDNTDNPEIYGKMRFCVETLTNQKEIFKTEAGDEIIGDYWGTLVLAQRMKNQNVKGPDSVRTVSMAIDGFCAPLPDPKNPRPPAHPEAQFRVNFTMARAPMMREVLGCEAPSKENPSCWLDGVLTKGLR